MVIVQYARISVFYMKHILIQILENFIRAFSYNNYTLVECLVILVLTGLLIYSIL